MSYRNPTQHIDRSLGRDVQQLQNTITSSFRAFGESYAKAQKEAAKNIKAETDRRTKLVTDLEAKKLTLNKGFSALKANNNSYDFQKILGNELDVYNEYATSIINKTITDPKEIARRKHRMAEIEALPTTLKTDLGIIGSYSENSQEKLDSAGTFGGYYLGGKAKGLEYMQVLQDNLKGARDVNLVYNEEAGVYNIDYTNTPEGSDPISINSRDLRAGEVGAKEIVATIPDPSKNQEAALKASGLYTKIRLKDGREEEVLNKSYLQEEETIPNPNGKGGKIRLQRVDKNKFINDPKVIEASKAYIAGLDPDDREALNNGIFAPQKDKDEFYIPSYGDNEEVNKANDALVLNNYLQYQADRIPSEKVLEMIEPEKPIKDKKLSAAQKKKAEDKKVIVEEYTNLIKGSSIDKALLSIGVDTNSGIMTTTGDDTGEVIGYKTKRNGKTYVFKKTDKPIDTFKKMLQFNGVLSDSEIAAEVEKLKEKINPKKGGKTIGFAGELQETTDETTNDPLDPNN